MNPEQINRLIKSTDDLKNAVGDLFGIKFRKYQIANGSDYIEKYSKGMTKMYEVLSGRPMDETEKRHVEEFTTMIENISNKFTETLTEPTRETEAGSTASAVGASGAAEASKPATQASGAAAGSITEAPAASVPELVVTPPPQSAGKTVAIWTETEWALGRVAYAMHKYSKHDINIIDWSFSENNVDLWTEGGWKDFDIILGNATITSYPWNEGLLSGEPPVELMKKLRPVIHSPCKGSLYEEKMKYPPYRIAGVSEEILVQLSNEYGSGPPRHLHLTPPGVDLDLFKQNLRTDKIKTLGFVGSESLPCETDKEKVKRSKMFLEICQKAGMNHKFIEGYSIEVGSEMFDGVDCVVCTSTMEGMPLSIVEAAASGCTVISTNVGIVKNGGFVTFETVDEAVTKLRLLNENDEVRNKYTRDVSDSVRKVFDWKEIVKRWDSFIDAEVTDADIENLKAPEVETKAEAETKAGSEAEEPVVNTIPDEAKKKVASMLKVPVRLSDGTMYSSP